MLIPAKYVLTPKITEALSSIESSKAVIDSITIPPEIETNIRRRSSLKSSLFSARIEGNALTLDELKTGSKELCINISYHLALPKLMFCPRKADIRPVSGFLARENASMPMEFPGKEAFNFAKQFILSPEGLKCG